MEEETGMTLEQACDKIYKAIRKTYGYDDDTDNLIDWVCEMADSYEFAHK